MQKIMRMMRMMEMIMMVKIFNCRPAALPPVKMWLLELIRCPIA